MHFWHGIDIAIKAFTEKKFDLCSYHSFEIPKSFARTGHSVLLLDLGHKSGMYSYYGVDR